MPEAEKKARGPLFLAYMESRDSSKSVLGSHHTLLRYSGFPFPLLRVVSRERERERETTCTQRSFIHLDVKVRGYCPLLRQKQC